MENKIDSPSQKENNSPEKNICPGEISGKIKYFEWNEQYKVNALDIINKDKTPSENNSEVA